MNIAVIIGCGNVGFAIIEKLAAEDWLIYAFDLKQPDYLINFIRKHNNVVFGTMNARDKESVKRSISVITEKVNFVLCTVGVNNHISPMSDFRKFADVVDINVMGNIIPIKELVNRSQIAEGGQIIVLGSTSGHFAGVSLDPYAVSKWILVNECESLQHELCHYGISLKIVNPRSIQNVHSAVFESTSGVSVNDVVSKILSGGSRSFVPKIYGLFHPIERCFPWLFDFAFGLKPSVVRNKSYSTSFQSILITGASSGLGKALAKKFAQTANSIYCVARNSKKLEDLKQEIENESNCHVVPICADLSDMMSIDTVLSFFDDKHIDLIINNAGQHVVGSILDCDVEVLRQSIVVNCLSHICITANLLNRESSLACIANILSTTAISGRTNLGIYSSPKAGLWAWTKVLRRNVGKEHHVVEVIPATFTSSLSANELSFNHNNAQGHSIFSSSTDNLTSEKVASAIVSGLKRKRDRIYVPKMKVTLFVALEAFCPSLFRKLFS